MHCHSNEVAGGLISENQWHLGLQAHSFAMSKETALPSMTPAYVHLSVDRMIPNPYKPQAPPGLSPPPGLEEVTEASGQKIQMGRFQQLGGDSKADKASGKKFCTGQEFGGDSEVETETASHNESFEDDDDDVLTELGRQQQIMRQQMMSEAASSYPFSSARMPLSFSGDGLPATVASAHVNGNCKACICGELGCNGTSCEFCQLENKRGRRKNKLRPCKGKRDRFRKLANRLMSFIELDPHFDLETVELPPSIASNTAVRTKLMATVQAHAEQVRTERQTGLQPNMGGLASTAASVQHPVMAGPSAPGLSGPRPFFEEDASDGGAAAARLDLLSLCR